MTSNSSQEDKEVALSKMFMDKKRRRTERHTSEYLRSQNRAQETEAVEPEPAQSNEEARQCRAESGSLTKSPMQQHISKPLPDLPALESSESSQSSDEGGESQKTHIKPKTSEFRSRHFSYVTGDDSFEWRKGIADTHSPKSTLNSHVNPPAESSGATSSNDPSMNTSVLSEEMHRLILPQNSNEATNLFPSSSQPKRWDSNSSIVTAIQDKPSRNSSDRRSGNGSGKKPDAAITAATRAMAANESKQGG